MITDARGGLAASVSRYRRMVTVARYPSGNREGLDLHHLDHAEKLLRATTLEEVTRVASGYARAVGFNRFSFAAMRSQPRSQPGRFLHFHDFSNAWSDSYARLERPEVACMDARILHARSGLPTNPWNTRGVLGYTRPDIARIGRKQARAAGEFDMKAGLTVPCHGPGIDWAFATFSTDATYDVRELASTIAGSLHFTTCLQSRVDQLRGTPAKLVALSPREREILSWIATGKTSWETSSILGISETTVNFHLRNACRKLDASNRLVACVRAATLGLIAA